MAGTSSREISRHLNTLFQCGATGSISDSELLERFVAGRNEAAEAAFAAIVERHGVMVLGVCRRILGHRDGADDAFQATFLVLARKAASIARREQLASWLHGVARHAALDARTRVLRQQAREKRLSVMRSAEPPDQTLASELNAVLDEELARLPERYRAAIVLCELEGLSRRDAAARLGISEGTLSSRISRGKTRLRGRLTQRGFALSMAALTTVLVQDAQAVLLPPMLVDSTIHVATIVASGSSLAGVVSTSVATLTEGVLKAMLLTKLKFGFLGVVALMVVTSSVGVLAQSAGPAQQAAGDRLKAVERKLDRLLEVLGGSGRQRTIHDPFADAQLAAPSADRPALPPPLPPAPAAAPAPGTAPAPPAVAQAPVPVPMPTAFPSAEARPAMAFDPHELARRVESVERRLVNLESRLGSLERRLDKAGRPADGRRSDVLTVPTDENPKREFEATVSSPGDALPAHSDVPSDAQPPQDDLVPRPE